MEYQGFHTQSHLETMNNIKKETLEEFTLVNSQNLETLAKHHLSIRESNIFNRAFRINNSTKKYILSSMLPLLTNTIKQ